LRENPLDTEEHMDFFEEKLTEFNERNNKQLAKVKKINAKLKTAGLDLFSENDESLELKIKEN
jgi:regulator of sigma D